MSQKFQRGSDKVVRNIWEWFCEQIKMHDKAGAGHPPCVLSASWGFPKVCLLLGGGELEEWKSCTFLMDGIRLPIGGARGIWKIIPHFPSWNKWCYKLWSGKGHLPRARAVRTTSRGAVRWCVHFRNNRRIITYFYFHALHFMHTKRPLATQMNWLRLTL